MDARQATQASQQTRDEAHHKPVREPPDAASKRKSSLMLDFSLLRDNAPFRAIVIARTLSVFSLGLLTVAAPVQIQDMTGAPMQVGLAMALGGGVGAVIAVGALVSLGAGVRILLPALAEDVYRVGPSAVGFMYSAVPLGATFAALTSGWLSGFARSGALLLASAASAFIALGALGLSNHLLVAFGALAAFGYLSSIASLLQFTLVQRHTPDQLLGRVNGLWAAQTVTGDAFGALTLGMLSRALPPMSAIFVFSLLALLASGMMAIGFRFLFFASVKRSEDAPAMVADKTQRPRSATLG